MHPRLLMTSWAVRARQGLCPTRRQSCALQPQSRWDESSGITSVSTMIKESVIDEVPGLGLPVHGRELASRRPSCSGP